VPRQRRKTVSVQSDFVPQQRNAAIVVPRQRRQLGATAVLQMIDLQDERGTRPGATASRRSQMTMVDGL
jgi:hypothetical protein